MTVHNENVKDPGQQMHDPENNSSMTISFGKKKAVVVEAVVNGTKVDYEKVAPKVSRDPRAGKLSGRPDADAIECADDDRVR